MTAIDKESGWRGVPAALHWCCPECLRTPPVVNWKAKRIDGYAESGRQCPFCEAVFDPEDGAARLAAAQT